MVLEPSVPTCHCLMIPTGATSEHGFLLMASIGNGSWNPCTTSLLMILVSSAM